jgi:putative transcriptional regulator
MHTGTFIQSTSLLDGTNFENAIIYINEHNDSGAVGFIVNKPFSRTLNQLEEFKLSIPFPLYEGGPVDTEHLFFMHQRPDIITGGTLVTKNVYVGGNFEQAISYLNNKKITSKDVKLFIGYCGWDDGELESEIAEGSWVVMQEGVVF